MVKKKVYSLVWAVGLMLTLTACSKEAEAFFQESKNELQESSLFENQTEKESKTAVVVEDFNPIATIEQVLIYDKNDVKITVNGLEYSDYYAELNITIENNSAKDLTFNAGSVAYANNAINGIMIGDGHIYVDIPAGKKINETIDFSIDNLMLHGITQIAEIQLSIKAEDKDYNHFYTGPMKIKTSIADSYDFSLNTYASIMKNGVFETLSQSSIEHYSETELYDQEGIQIISQALVTTSNEEKILMYEVVNTSEQFIYLDSSNISINGLEIYPFSCGKESINPKTRRVVTINLSNLLADEYIQLLVGGKISEIGINFKLVDINYDDITPESKVCFVISSETPKIDTSGTELYNNKGIRIISKGLYESPSEYDNGWHWLLLIENNYTEMVTVEDEDDSLSLNNYMLDYIAYDTQLDVGQHALMIVQIDEDSLITNSLDNINSVTCAEMKFTIRTESYKEIDNFEIQNEFNN